MRISDWSSDVCSSDLSDNIHFSLTTLQLNPLHFNREYARENGHADIVISAMLVFAIVFGLSVEDLSERGGAFLGVDDLSFARPVHVGDTLTARSTVMADRKSTRLNSSHQCATRMPSSASKKHKNNTDFS